MTLEQLSVFVPVAEREHLTRAAEILNLTQCATSSAIAALEERHAIRLFDRIGRGIVLNPTGRDFLVEARGVLARAAPAERRLGDLAGTTREALTLEHQPAKVMAMEGHFDSHPDGAPLILFGIPNMETRTVEHAIAIPKMSSLILKHDLNGPLAGLDTVAREDWPPVPIVFWSFRIMISLGFAMLGLGILSLVARWRRHLHDWRPLNALALVMGPAGVVAVLAGWVTTEVGRQPFTVYGALRTADSASPVAAPAVGASLIAFMIVYGIVFAACTFHLTRLMNAAPGPHEPGLVEGQPVRAAGIAPAPAIDPDAVVPGQNRGETSWT